MNKEPLFKPIKPLKCPLTPYQLFTPVATVFLDNLTYEEQLLGLCNLYNKLVKQINGFGDEINQLHTSIEEIYEILNTIQTNFELAINNLINKIESGDEKTLEQSKNYTDQKFGQIDAVRYGALTAEEYDSLNLTCEQYESYNFTAREYDTLAKWILFGVGNNNYIWKLPMANNPLHIGDSLKLPPPVLPMREGKYIMEVSLPTNSSNGSRMVITPSNTSSANFELNLANTSRQVITLNLSYMPELNIMQAYNLQNEAISPSDDIYIDTENAYIKLTPFGEYAQ